MSEERYKEIYISVDGEMSGPNRPGYHSLLSIGACLVNAPEYGFYVELKPLNDNADPEASRIHGLDIERLKQEGINPREAMKSFVDWAKDTAAAYGGKPVFVAFPAPFDWMFIDWYIQTYFGETPFKGALDMKSYFMGMMNCLWQQTRKSELPAEFLSDLPHTHNALDDAREQADVFRKMLAYRDRHILQLVSPRKGRPRHK